ncbi:MAG: hypothetical protein EOS76_06835 [Mesorhizobium sp.]|uniref:Cap15 family cyclic dinucleotide receptor domain-containing protein n=1 Tax=unclassified Mesorhizobium TaxID=325217 RepID=UPI000F75951D|nr:MULTISPECIES: hypothetical protein [unclassified Mesorhizobium]RVC80996.1 hypothetical protein EN766_04180 [Mesorhizobium sp. M2A.F.Ca.ET.046.02.1.1]AZO34030.1 hypothetical protein EJ072_05550 [Mesorhizobium sp. M2A.F.Ca.ET.046.03.2.1]AZO71453.1 hypothetical protein EJ067_09900 [Mesorhizobium sp. M1D.F.Ca.ET.043.01.1.1]RWB47014.1 MAG: hypothetical protein EOQ44_07500 [Mesorhizobium sp.]RWE20801.1 MAG: hypothetical protein EOS76_06835 [Mesorhizobium sp.]
MSPNNNGSVVHALGDANLPNIAGRWSMNITWQRGEKTGDVKAAAIIREDSNGISMEVQSKNSDSRTIFARYGREGSSGPVLHYLYEVEPKFLEVNNDGPYKGAAILRFYEDGNELRGNYWTSQLSKGHFRLRRWTQAESEVIAGERTDVLLITAIEEEFVAAKVAFTALMPGHNGVREWRLREDSSSCHLAGTFFSGGEPLFTLALAKPTRMGANRTGALAMMLAERLRPRYLVMCGVCAGNPADLALGDVVVSEMTYQYDEGKVDQCGFTGDHRQSPVSIDWLRAADALSAEATPSYGRPTDADARFWIMERLNGGGDPKRHPARRRYFEPGKWRAAVEALEADALVVVEGDALRLTSKGENEVRRSILMDVDPPARLPFAIKRGPIASGNVVVKDGLTWDMLARMGVRSVLGLEMEAAVIGEVARSAGIERWIVIKGVMDHADPKKDDRFKPFAARASAEVLRVFLIGRFSALSGHSANRKGPSASQSGIDK